MCECVRVCVVNVSECDTYIHTHTRAGENQAGGEVMLTETQKLEQERTLKKLAASASASTVESKKVCERDVCVGVFECVFVCLCVCVCLCVWVGGCAMCVCAIKTVATSATQCNKARRCVNV
jgi:hypothetical protein